MKKYRWVTAAALALAAAAAALSIVILTRYNIAGFAAYPRNAETLDLRGEELTVEEYLSASSAMPGTKILWNVPLDGGSISSDTKEISVYSLSDADVDALSLLEELQTVHAETCTDYAQLQRLREMKPGVTFYYNVTIGGESYPQDTVELHLEALSGEDAALLEYLPALRSLRIDDGEPALMTRLQTEHPEWNLSYAMALGESLVEWDAETAEPIGASVSEVEQMLPYLRNLTEITLINPAAEGGELLQLREDHPELDVHWQIQAYGKTFSDDTVEMDISGVIVESVDEVAALADALPQLEKLIMSDCGIDNDTMAEFRESRRDRYKVVWTVYFTDKCKARTDETYFMPIKQGEYYFQEKHAYNLRYCEDMVCIDLGHSTVSEVEWCKYMPHLKYLILAHTAITYIDDIKYCQELVYLEVDWSTIRDLSPIAELKNLEDININNTYCDVSPLCSMTWLKHLWVPNHSYSEQQMLIEALPDTQVCTGNVLEDGTGWRNLQNYYDMRDYLGMYYMS